MKNQKNERGITLVALVVTIVVLLILAGITIMYVMSDNGVFGQAKYAGTQTNGEAVKEAVQLAISGLYVPIYTGDGDADLGQLYFDALPATMKPSTKPTIAPVTTGKNADLSIPSHTISYGKATYTVAYENGALTVTGSDGYTSAAVTTP